MARRLNVWDKEVKTCHNSTAGQKLDKKQRLFFLKYFTLAGNIYLICFNSDFGFTFIHFFSFSSYFQGSNTMELGPCGAAVCVIAMRKISPKCFIHVYVLFLSFFFFIFSSQEHNAITAVWGCCMCYCDAQYIFMNNVSRPW